MNTLNTNQYLDISADKLSAPIEELNLEQRAFHMLRRVGLKTVSQIIVVGKLNILSVRNIGPLLAGRIFLAVADYLGVPEDILASDGIRELAVKEQEKPLNPLNDSVDVLDLPINIILLLKKVGVLRIEQLIKSRSSNYVNISQFRYMEVRKIDRALNLYMKEFGKNTETHVDIPQSREEKQTIRFLPLRDLNLALNSIQLNERTWLIIGLRSVRLLTLEEIAVEIGGVTRERVRQIIDQVNEKVRKKLNLLLVFIDYFNDRAKFIRSKLKNKNATIATLACEFSSQLSGSDLIATEEDLERFIAIIRMLVILDKPWAHENFGVKRKELTILVCLVEPSIEKNKKVHRLLESEKLKNKKLTYKEIVYMVLSEAKRPLHWREIAEKAYKLNKKERFETRALYHVLLDHEELFVRVGQGTYELVEWGNKQVEPYPDIIASVLKREKQAIPIDSVLAKVSAVRSVKQPSLIMYLDMHPRFYKSINNTYGLRGWLPPREKQNLRTPEWLIEDSKSVERVERARQRGYDIESIIAEDKLI